MPIIPKEECGYCLPNYCLTKLELIPRIHRSRTGTGDSIWILRHELSFEVCIDDVKCTIPRNSWLEPPHGLWIPNFVPFLPGADGGIHPPGTDTSWQGVLGVRLRHPRPPAPQSPPGHPIKGAVICWLPTAGGVPGDPLGGGLTAGFPGIPHDTDNIFYIQPDNIGGTVFDGGRDDINGVEKNLICCKPLPVGHPMAQPVEGTGGISTAAKTCCEALKNKLCKCLNTAADFQGLPVGTSAGNCCFAGTSSNLLHHKVFASKAAATSASQDGPNMMKLVNRRKWDIINSLRRGISERLSFVLDPANCGIGGSLDPQAPQEHPSQPSFAERNEFALNCRCYGGQGPDGGGPGFGCPPVF